VGRHCGGDYWLRHSQVPVVNLRYPHSKIQFLYLILLFSLLSACADAPKKWDSQGYTVKRGDTLYSIAWRYEKDYRQVAQINNITSPYAIYPGQRLRMQAVDKDGSVIEESRPQVLVDDSTGQAVVIEEAELSAPAAQSARKPEHVKVKKNETLYGIARREGYSHHQLARWNHLRSPYALKPGQRLRLSPPASALGQSGARNASRAASKAPVATKAPQVKPVTQPLIRQPIKATPIIATRPTVKSPSRVASWQWPVSGRIVQRYKANDTARKGIGIAGKLGQPIEAAAAGTVVYSGNGLINYGNLVIIKHSHSFLSAYAYNQSLLVKEGDSVKRGQAIAKMGKLDTKPQLHFEIRRNGKPVNPLYYLPKS